MPPDDAPPPVEFTPDVLQAFSELLAQWAPKSREQAVLNGRCWDQLEVAIGAAVTPAVVQRLPPSFGRDVGNDSPPGGG